MSQQPNRFIFPLYQTLLSQACSLAQTVLFTGNAEQAWQATKKLRILIRDPEDRARLDKYVKLIEQNIQADRPNGITDAERQIQTLRKRSTLDGKAEVLLDMIYGSLERNGYFERKSRESTANITMEEFEQSISPPPME